MWVVRVLPSKVVTIVSLIPVPVVTPVPRFMRRLVLLASFFIIECGTDAQFRAAY